MSEAQQSTPTPRAKAEPAAAARVAAVDARAARRGPTPGMPMLALVRPLAALAIAAMLTGRAFGPAALGSGTGLGRLLWGLEFSGNLLSQMLAILATVFAVAEVLVLLRTRVPLYLQIMGVTTSAIVLLVGLTAAVIRLPTAPAALIGLGAAVLALLVAIDAARSPFGRHAAMVLGAVSIASLLRLAAVLVSSLGSSRAALAVTTPRALATGAFVLEALAIGLGLAWVASRSRRITTPATFVVLIIAFLLTRLVIVSPLETTSAGTVLLRGGVERLLVRPDPFLPRTAVVFAAVLAPLTASAALFARGQVPALSGAIALALLVRSTAEMPMGAITLVIASLTVALAARDERGFWATMVAHGPRAADGDDDERRD
jgi:hypothetical protein